MVPITIVDNFFENPNQVVSFANSLAYNKDPLNQWPGVRTKWIHELNRPFFDNFCNKLLSIFFDLNDPNFNWEISLAFQKIDNTFNKGWIHTDAGRCITAIVYLNEVYNRNSGTSIMSKKVLTPNITFKQKEEFFKSGVETDEIKKARKLSEDQFEECVAIRNKFNRLVVFPSQLYHKAQDFDNSDERLTLIAFVRYVTATKMPLSDMRQIIV
jgi:hypothetical protein